MRPSSSGMNSKKKARSPFDLNPSSRVEQFRKHLPEEKLKFMGLGRERSPAEEARGKAKARQKPSLCQMKKLG